MTDSRHAVAFDRFLVPRGAMGAALLATTLLAATLRGIDAQCSSAACQAGHCVDAEDGSAELGAAASCAAALSAEADCSAQIGGVAALGNVCARACGWCAPLMAFADPAQIDTTFCSSHSAATCAPATGSGTSAAVCEATDLVGAVGGLHPVAARETCEGPTGSPTGCAYQQGTNSPSGCVLHPFKFAVDEMAWLTGSGDVTNPVAVVVKAQKLDGAGVAQLSAAKLTSWGVTEGDALQFVQRRDMMYRQVMPGTRAFAASDAAADLRAMVSSSPTAALDLLAAAGSTPFTNPQQLEITVIIEQLHDVAEMDFTFTVQFRLMMSWYDTSVFQACNGADPWADDPVECPEVWRPEVAFLNLREIEWIGKSEFYAMPAGWDAEMGGTGTGPATVFVLARAVGTFTAPMGFQNFPSDVQSLPIQLYLKHPPDSVMRSQLVIKPKATLAKELAARKTSTSGLDTLSGWDIDSTNAKEFEHTDFDVPSLRGGGGAFDNYIDTVVELGLPMEDSNRLSAAEFNIVIERKSRYFVLNYVLIVALLTAVSWLTFFLDPTGLDARAGVALTLLLAIGVFQLILNDTMPKTGYLTPMHVFVLMSTFWVVLVLVESLIVCELSKKQAVKESVAAKISRLPRPLRPPRGSGADDGAEAEQAHLQAAPEEQMVSSQTKMGRACSKDTLSKVLAEQMDTASLVLFPLSYAIATAIIFRGG